MTREMLVYVWDEKDGRMRLQANGFRLNETNRVAWETELRRQYESLITQLERGEAKVAILLETSSTDSEAGDPVEFLVRYGEGLRTRSPALILEPAFAVAVEWTEWTSARKAAVSHEPPTAVGSGLSLGLSAEATESRQLAVCETSPWVAGFLDDVMRRLSDETVGRLANADRFAIGFILAELEELCRDDPDDLALVLLAGFVAISERRCDLADAREAGFYQLAARRLDEWCGQRLNESGGQGTSSGAIDRGGRRSPGPARSLRRIARFLGRVLGLQDETDWELSGD
jgi:hypothetical protein